MQPETAFGDLRLVVDATQGDCLRVDLLGKSNSREPGRELLPWFNDALREAGRSGARLEVHFEKLEHFNSSTIAALIQVINAAQVAKVKMVMVYAHQLRWQALSFEALQRAMKPFAAAGSGEVDFRKV